MSFLQSWVRGLVAASAAAALASQLTPAGPVKKVTELACGVMLMAVLVSPVIKADMKAFSYALSDYRNTVARVTQDMEAQEKQLIRLYIEQQTAAYILDEAHSLGISDLEVSVRSKWGDESWIPYEAVLRGVVLPEQQNELREYMESQLGIPLERQRWNE